MSGFPQGGVSSINGATGAVTTGYGISGTSPAVGLTPVESFIGAPVGPLGAATATNVTSVSLVAGTWNIDASVELANSAAGADAYCEAWIGPTTAATTGAYGGGSAYVGLNTGTGTPVTRFNFKKTVVLAVTTTVFLIAKSPQTTITVESATQTSSIPNVTGISATRIA